MDWIWLFVPVAVALSATLTGLARWLAPQVGLVDHPDNGRKRHARSTPVMGGVAVFCTLAICGCVLYWLDPRVLAGGKNDGATRLLLISAALFCLLGLCDDKWGVRARNKFLWQVIACLPFAIWGPTVNAVSVFGTSIPLGSWAIPFSVFWLVACSNVINLVDGLDGLAGTIGLLVAVALSVVALLGGHLHVAALSLILAGSLGGFLIHNWPPAKIFLGDSGSLPLGFLLGALSLESSFKQATGFALVVPLVLISIPVFDTLMAIVRRKLRGKSIGTADRAHIHHRLQDRGLSRVQALLVITGLCAMMASFGVASTFYRNDLVAVALCGGLLGMLVTTRVFGFHEAAMLGQHLREIGFLLADTSRLLPSRLLIARLPHADADERDEYWDKLCTRVENMGCVRLQFRCTDVLSMAKSQCLEWINSSESDGQHGTWYFRYSLYRNETWQAEFEAEGVTSRSIRTQRLDDLFRLFDSFSRHWPIDQQTEDSRSQVGLTPKQGFVSVPIEEDESKGHAPASQEDRDIGFGGQDASTTAYRRRAA